MKLDLNQYDRIGGSFDIEVRDGKDRSIIDRKCGLSLTGALKEYIKLNASWVGRSCSAITQKEIDTVAGLEEFTVTNHNDFTGRDEMYLFLIKENHKEWVHSVVVEEFRDESGEPPDISLHTFKSFPAAQRCFDRILKDALTEHFPSMTKEECLKENYLTETEGKSFLLLDKTGKMVLKATRYDTILKA